MIWGEHALNTLFCLDRVWNKYGTGMEWTRGATSISGYCTQWSGMEVSGTEFEDLLRISGSGSGSGRAFLLVPDQSY